MFRILYLYSCIGGRSKSLLPYYIFLFQLYLVLSILFASHQYHSSDSRLHQTQCSHWNDARTICLADSHLHFSHSSLFFTLYYSRTPIYRDARGKGFCPVNRGARYIGVKYH